MTIHTCCFDISAIGKLYELVQNTYVSHKAVQVHISAPHKQLCSFLSQKLHLVFVNNLINLLKTSLYVDLCMPNVQLRPDKRQEISNLRNDMHVAVRGLKMKQFLFVNHPSNSNRSVTMSIHCLVKRIPRANFVTIAVKLKLLYIYIDRRRISCFISL